MRRSSRREFGTWSPIIDAALPIFLVLMFGRFYFESSIVFYGITSILVAYGYLLLILVFARTPVNSLGVIVVLTLMFFSFFNAILGKNQTIFDALQFLGNMGFAFAAARYAKLRPNVYLFLFFAISAFFIQKIINGVDPEGVFTVSRNYVSVITILSISFYYFACNQTNEKPKLIVPIFGLVFALWGIGRSGIASIALILLGTLLLTRKRTLASLCIITFIAVFFLYMRPELLDNLELLYAGLERFDKMGIEGQRSYINSEYLSAALENLQNLFFGAPLNEIHSIVEVDGNPHNSYIRLHIVFGLIGVGVGLIIIFNAIRRLLNADSYLILLILLVSAFRSIFDSTAFYGPLDVPIFYCVFYAFRSSVIVFCKVMPKRGLT